MPVEHLGITSRSLTCMLAKAISSTPNTFNSADLLMKNPPGNKRIINNSINVFELLLNESLYSS